MRIHTYPDSETLARGAATFICDLALAQISQLGEFSLVLSGGSTPRDTYQELAVESLQRDLDWSKVKIYWGDERCVPPEDDQSNYRMACKALFNHIPIPKENLHRMACEHDPEIGAVRYERLLRTHFPDQAFPRFDLILLGLGDDGHTASLFPDTGILTEQERWVAPVFVPKLDSWRISLTLPALNAADHIAFLVTGEHKATVLKEIVDPSFDPKYPAQFIAPRGTITWFIDQAAGQLLAQ